MLFHIAPLNTLQALQFERQPQYRQMDSRKILWKKQQTFRLVFLSEKANIVALFRQICYSPCTDWLHVNASSKPMRIVDQMLMRGRSMLKNRWFHSTSCSLFLAYLLITSVSQRRPINMSQYQRWSRLFRNPKQNLEDFCVDTCPRAIGSKIITICQFNLLSS